MPRPSKITPTGIMSPAQVEQWMIELRLRGIADTDHAIAALLGRSHDTVAAMRKRGADHTTALACTAILNALPPFGTEEERRMRPALPAPQGDEPSVAA